MKRNFGGFTFTSPNNLVTLPDSSIEGDGEDDGRGAAELGAEGALGLVTTVFTACCIASQLILEEEASVDCGLPEKLKIALFKCKIYKTISKIKIILY